MDLPIAANTVLPGAGDRQPATGTPGECSSGSPTATPPVPATECDAFMMNVLYLELLNVIDEAGLSRNGLDLTQVYQAIELLIGKAPHGSAFFLGSFSGATEYWTCPAGIYSVQVRIWASGGGGGSTTGASAGGGGAGGEYIGFTAAVVPGTVYPVTLGAYGAAGASGGAGGAGGNVSFLGATAVGGGGGGAGTAGGSAGSGGVAGNLSGSVAPPNSVVVSGLGGQPGLGQSSIYLGGGGGAAAFGGAGGHPSFGASSLGQIPGGGGGGAISSGTGGYGGASAVYIIW